jgi:hypothetical protein
VVRLRTESTPWRAQRNSPTAARPARGPAFAQHAGHPSFRPEMNSQGLEMIEAPSAGAIVGQSIYSLIAPEDRERFKDFHERVCGGEKASLQFDIIGQACAVCSSPIGAVLSGIRIMGSYTKRGMIGAYD